MVVPLVARLWRPIKHSFAPWLRRITMSDSHEKRENLRAPLDTEVRYSMDGSSWRKARSKDVSPHGIQLAGEETISPGRRLHLVFNLPNLKFQDPIKAEAEVVRVINSRGMPAGMGLRFVSLSGHSYRAVEIFVQRILGYSMDESQEEAAVKRETGEYTFMVERLARDSESTKQEAADRKLQNKFGSRTT